MNIPAVLGECQMSVFLQQKKAPVRRYLLYPAKVTGRANTNNCPGHTKLFKDSYMKNTVCGSPSAILPWDFLAGVLLGEVGTMGFLGSVFPVYLGLISSSSSCEPPHSA